MLCKSMILLIIYWISIFCKFKLMKTSIQLSVSNPKKWKPEFDWFKKLIIIMMWGNNWGLVNI